MYDTLMKEVHNLLATHHKNLGTNTHDTDIAVNAVIQKIREAGGTDAEGLRQFSWEDLQKCGAPLALAKRMAQIFRGSKGGSEDRQAVTPKAAARMSISELIAAYDPRDPRSPIAGEIEKLSKGRPCIVFTQNGAIHEAASLACIQDLLDGETPRFTFLIDQRPHPVYCVGERPPEMSDENPLYPGRALRADQTCTQTQRSWEGVPRPVRLLLYLARRQGELSIESISNAHDALDLALSADEKRIRTRYPQASMAYDRDERLGALPMLKVAKGTAAQPATNANPFPANRVR